MIFGRYVKPDLTVDGNWLVPFNGSVRRQPKELADKAIAAIKADRNAPCPLAGKSPAVTANARHRPGELIRRGDG